MLEEEEEEEREVMWCCGNLAVGRREREREAS